MDKLYYLWLEAISLKNSELDYKLYNEKIYNHKEKIKENFLKGTLDLKAFDGINVSQKLIRDFINQDCTKYVKYLYEKICKYNFDIVTIEDPKYPRSILENENLNIPFCYITNSKSNLNDKNIYIYYNDYFSRQAKDVVKYFCDIASEEKANIITEYNLKKVKKINIVSSSLFLDLDMFDMDKEYVILPDSKYLEQFKLNVVNALIIVEARYEDYIVRVVDMFCLLGKDVYVVPSSILTKNSYFSNYLIKQGADVILNKWDLKFILRRII